jgi:hypothetical protein
MGSSGRSRGSLEPFHVDRNRQFGRLISEHQPAQLKLFTTEPAMNHVTNARLIHGGTNRIQRLIIARQA